MSAEQFDMKKKPTLLLVDDSKLFNSLVTRILSSEYTVVGTAADGYQGIAQYTKLAPDCVLLDITMPNLNGKDCLREILKIDPKARVVMVSSLGDDATVAECLANGALGFVNKETISIRNEPGKCTLAKALRSALGEGDTLMAGHL